MRPLLCLALAAFCSWSHVLGQNSNQYTVAVYKYNGYRNMLHNETEKHKVEYDVLKQIKVKRVCSIDIKINQLKMFIKSVVLSLCYYTVTPISRNDVLNFAIFTYIIN